jgi:hypothetical protein
MSKQRPLTPDERTTLLRILEAAPVDGASELRAQVDETTVVDGLDTFLDLKVAKSATRSTVPDGHIPVRAFVYGADGVPEGELLVWVADGYLSAFEFAWTTDEMPRTFPPAERIRVEAE